jgi:hypothetical protein
MGCLREREFENRPGLLGLFVLCVGGFMAGGGINKALSERNNNDKSTDKKEE